MITFVSGALLAFLAMGIAAILVLRRGRKRARNWVTLTRRDMHRGLAEVHLVVPRRRAPELDSNWVMDRLNELLDHHGECGEVVSGPRRYLIVTTGDASEHLVVQSTRIAEELGVTKFAALRIFEKNSTTPSHVRLRSTTITPRRSGA